ncbi:MAG: CHRD domain-containing protein [Devosia sp.]
MNIALKTLAVASIASLALTAAPALADQIKYTAALTATDETPATDSKATGTVDATYDSDTMTLTWTIEYKDLSGPVTAAHFHGPAKLGEKADPVVPIDAPYDSPISGSMTLTDEQYSQLSQQLWYFNLHTEKYPDGEIRGQVVPAHP